MGKQSSWGADAAAFPLRRLTRALCNQPPAAPVDWAGLLVNLRGMSNRDGMAQSAGKPTLPPGRAAGATLVQPTVRLGVRSAGLLPLQAGKPDYATVKLVPT